MRLRFYIITQPLAGVAPGVASEILVVSHATFGHPSSPASCVCLAVVSEDVHNTLEMKAGYAGLSCCACKCLVQSKYISGLMQSISPTIAQSWIPPAPATLELYYTWAPKLIDTPCPLSTSIKGRRKLIDDVDLG